MWVLGEEGGGGGLQSLHMAKENDCYFNPHRTPPRQRILIHQTTWPDFEVPVQQVLKVQTELPAHGSQNEAGSKARLRHVDGWFSTIAARHTF